jgi:hypothetical protein
VPHEVHVVAGCVVLAEVAAAGLVAGQRGGDQHLGQVEQEAQLDRLEQVGVEPLALVLHGHVA